MTQQASLVFLRLMQLADSGFPAGAFTQSFGMETFIQSGDIRNKQELTQFMQTFLYFTWRPTDLLTVKLAWQATKHKNSKRLELLDRRLNAMKLPAESREGSLKMGRRLRQLLSETDQNYRTEVHFPYGHQAIILGHYGAVTGIDLTLLLAAYAHMTTSSLIANGVRAIPLGQTSGQQVLSCLQPLLDDCIQWVISAIAKDFGGSAPAFDWAGMAHERLYSRIFMS
jgi:urease accessory protein